MPATVSRSAPEERLVNLVVALMATEQGLTKDTILSSVAGYREQLEAGASKDALEKMFERDKESLRGLGVPIETIGNRADPDDLREARYRVPTAEYALPEDITFSPAEVALLNIAGGVWGSESLSADARSGLRKIRALGIPVDEPIIGYAPRIRVRDASFAALQRAIEQCRVVTFAYLRPGEARPRERRVQPLALVEYEARWHVYGYDLNVDADRTFLLSRIVGEVAATRKSFPAEQREGAGERALDGLRAVAARQRALLEVHPGTEAALRLDRRAQAAPQGIYVPYVDLHVFADELASYGPEVRVVEPADLRSEVIRRLEATLALHGGAA
ncbi:proteasome accessory factor B [Microbacterium testaceum]|uniref:helix-turn-helix transcriptional regulator n=1 Tax=Microbacterium TaxID=33882 RepID=UPI00226ED1BB|nr:MULTISPECIES: WYL domain-containing protein [Microbacterium]MDQ1113612.1 proteasome accessory factor B [Microbacterium testaceum]MDQ1177748.1 proteasome accessory factor B [Microbacterium sp. SORGH_AS_0421]MDR6099287.1 proteasome accessory factor B [Microbacterium sp. SORGH_AS_0454]WAC69016.1 WYL domain-containing protein [Microbacterium sp. SL75]